jgi:hypothetical protein
VSFLAQPFVNADLNNRGKITCLGSTRRASTGAERGGMLSDFRPGLFSKLIIT